MKKPRNKKYTPKPSTSQTALSDVAYKLKNNKLKMEDTYNVLIISQHLFWVQAASKDMDWKLTSLKYLNSVKNSLKKMLDLIESQCYYDEDGSARANPTMPIKLHPRTRDKLLYFIIKIYTPTLQLWSSLKASKMSKLKAEARQQLDFFILLHCPKVANFLY
jgi:hypothetical protein